jgi:hypothetical protein
MGYTITVREYGSDHDVELVRVNANPEAIAAGLRKKMLNIKHSVFEPGARVVKIPKYTWVRIVED